MLIKIQSLIDKTAEQTTVVAGLTVVVDSVVAALVALKTALETVLANGVQLSPADVSLLDAAIANADANIAAVRGNVQELSDAVVVNTPAN